MSLALGALVKAATVKIREPHLAENICCLELLGCYEPLLRMFLLLAGNVLHVGVSKTAAEDLV